MKRGLVLLLLLFAVCAYAEPLKQGSIQLIAMASDSSGTHGTLAALSLEIHPGNERVFLETFPLTKVTTQASLRFAQQIACDTLDVDCSNYDFFYTIHALPGLVGGPSAGSSAALLTAALLLNRSLPDDFATTGTINSGGVIGPVGGMEHKVAAASGKMRTIYVPKGSKNLTINKTSMSPGFIKKMFNVTVVEVSEFRELLNLTLGIPFNYEERDIVMDERYAEIMHEVGLDLCKRSRELASYVDASRVAIALNLTSRAESALKKGSSYAAASFCFRANVELRNEWLSEQNISDSELQDMAGMLLNRIDAAKSEFMNHSISTITDLQTFMAVMERIEEAEEALKDRNDTIYVLAYAEERLYSALAWARFFDDGGLPMRLDDDSLRASCISKISEAEERLNYLASVLSIPLQKTRDELEKAKSYLLDDRYIMCLFAAAKAKSETNVILNLIGVKESDFEEIIDMKIRIANNAIAKSLDKGIFPIIAYSYLEYAKNLRPLDRVSALLFAEYALELSGLDIYFVKEERVSRGAALRPVPVSVLAGIAIGALIGSGIAFIILGRKRVNPRRSRKTLAGARKHLRGKKR